MKLVTALAWLVVVGLALVLLLGLTIPLFTDESTVVMQLSRPLLEGGRMYSLFPQCSSSWSVPLPVTWYPAAALFVGLAVLGPAGLRIVSFVFASGCLGVAARAIARTTQRRPARLRRVGMYLAPHAIGAVPLALVSERAEPLLTLALLGYVAFPLFWSMERRRTTLGRALLVSAFFVLTSVFTYAHSKALFFAPFVLVSLAFTFASRRWGWLVLALALVTLTFGQTTTRAKRFGECPEAPWLQGMIRSLTLSPKLAVVDPKKFAARAVENTELHLRDIPAGMKIVPKAPWLPHVEADRPAAVAFVDRLVDAWLSIFVVAAPLAVLAVAVQAFRRRRFLRPIALALALVASTALLLPLTVNWNFYSSPFVISTLAIAATIAAFVARRVFPRAWRARLRSAAVVLAAPVLGVVVISLATTLIYFGPRLVAFARTPGTHLPGAPASIPVYGFGKEREKIRALAARCGLGDGARRLVIDDASYYAFEGLKEPMHLIYVSDDTMWGPYLRGNRNPALLHRLGASGIISRCQYFPTALLETAKKADGYCCVDSSAFLPPRFGPGTTIVFGDHGNADGYLLDGWSWAEPTGRWNIGGDSKVTFELEAGPPTTISMQVSVLIAGDRRSQDIDIDLDGTLLRTLHFRDGDFHTERIEIPARATPLAYELDFRAHDVRSPRELGIAEDDRPAALWVANLRRD